MAFKWLDSFKDKVSNWYNDGDQFYLRTVVDPIINLGKDVYNSAPALSEIFTPYGDVKAGADVLDSGVSDIKNGNYISGATKVAFSPIFGSLMLLAPNGVDAPIKASTKSLTEPLYIYTGKELGKAPGRGRPASNINEATGKPITLDDIKNALEHNGRRVYEGMNEAETKSAILRETIDRQNKYKQVIAAQERRDARKYAKSSSATYESNKRAPYAKRAKEQIFGNGDTRLTSYIDPTEYYTYNPKKSIEWNYEKYKNSLLDDFYFTEREASDLFNEAYKSFFSTPKNEFGGELNYLSIFKP